jgi:hypothetical protein
VTLADLFTRVRAMGGKITRAVDGAFSVQGVADGLLAPDIHTALVGHRAELTVVVPTPPEPPKADARDTGLPDMPAEDGERGRTATPP